MLLIWRPCSRTRPQLTATNSPGQRPALLGRMEAGLRNVILKPYRDVISRRKRQRSVMGKRGTVFGVTARGKVDFLRGVGEKMFTNVSTKGGKETLFAL